MGLNVLKVVLVLGILTIMMTPSAIGQSPTMGHSANAVHGAPAVHPSAGVLSVALSVESVATTSLYGSLVLVADVTASGLPVAGASVNFQDEAQSNFVPHTQVTNSSGVAVSHAIFNNLAIYYATDLVFAFANYTGYSMGEGTNSVALNPNSVTELTVGSLSVNVGNTSSGASDVLSGKVFDDASPALAVSGATVTIVDTISSNFAPPVTTTDSNGNFLVSFTVGTVSTYTLDVITATASSSGFGTSSSSVPLQAVPATASTLSVAMTMFRPAQTTEPYDYMVVGATVSANGLPVAGASVTFSDFLVNTQAQSDTFWANPVITNSTGVAIDQVQFAPASSGWDYITASATDSGYTGGEGTGSVYIGAYSLTQLQVEMSVSQVTVSGQTTDVVSGLVFTDDVVANGVTGATVSLSDTAGTAFSPASTITDSSGNFRVTFLPATVTKNTIDFITASATYSTYEAEASTRWLTIAPVATPDMTVQVTTFHPAQSTEPDNYMVVGATVTSGGTPLAGASVTFSDSQSARFFANPVVTNSTGVAIDQVQFSSSNTGWDYVSATASDTGYVSDEGTNTVYIGAMSGTQLQLEMAVSQSTVSGQTTDVVSGEVFTGGTTSNGVGGVTVSLSDTLGSVFSPASASTDTSGGFRVTFLPATVAKNMIDYVTGSASYSTYGSTASTVWLTDTPMASPDLTVQVTTFYPAQNTEPYNSMVVGATVTCGGVPISGASVTFADTQSAHFWANPVTTNSTGVAIDQLQLSGSNTGWDFISATASSTGYTGDEGTNTVLIGAIGTTQLQVEVSVSQVTVSGQTTDIVSGEVFTDSITSDGVSGATVLLSDTVGSLFSPASVTTDTSGGFRVLFYPATVTKSTIDYLTVATTFSTFTPTSSTVWLTDVPVTTPDLTVQVTTFYPAQTTEPYNSMVVGATVTSGGMPVSGASVTFADTQSAKFFANPVTTNSSGVAIDQVQFTVGYTGWDYISATASDTGYISDEGTNTVLIGAISGTQLQVEMSVSQVTVSGQTTDVVSGEVFTSSVLSDGVNGAKVSFSDSVGSSFIPSSMTTDTSGGFRVTFYPTIVAKPTIDYLTVSATYSTYAPSASTMWLTDTPMAVPDLTVQMTTFYPGQYTEPYDYMVVGATVSSGGVAVSGASVTFADTQSARFLANPVTTNSTGVAIDQVQFVAGYTGWDFFTAKATDTGYTSDVGTNTVQIGTVSTTQLQLTMSVSQVMVSGETTDVVSGEVFTNSVTSNGVSGATVSLSDTVGSTFEPSSTTTDTSGNFRITFYPTSVLKSTIDCLTVSASFSSYQPTASTMWLTDIPMASPDMTVQVTTFYPAQFTEPLDYMVVGATVSSGGAPLAGATVTFEDSMGDSFWADPVTTNATGVAIDQMQLSSSDSGWDYVFAAVTDSGYTNEVGTNTVNVGAVSATQLEIEMAASLQTVPGGRTDVLSGHVFTSGSTSDSVKGALVALSDSLGATFTSAQLITDASGNFQTNFTLPQVTSGKVDFLTASVSYGAYTVSSSAIYVTVYAAMAVPSITSFVANPAAIQPDAWTNLTTVASGGVGALSYTYTGLPYGCFTQNLSTLACRPTSIGTYNVTVTVKDLASHTVSMSTMLTVANPSSVPVISSFVAVPVTLPLGNKTTLTVLENGGSGTVIYAYTGLPLGCASHDLAVLSCTPTKVGTYTVRVFANDSFMNSATAIASLVVVPVTSIPVILSFVAEPNTVTAGSTTWLNVSASGGVSYVHYTYTGLPAGCSSANTTSLSCAPTAIGSYTVRVFVNDSVGESASAVTTLKVIAPVTGQPPAINSFEANPDVVTAGNTVTFTVSASGGAGYVRYVYTGLPAGCVSTNSTSLSCAPTASGDFIVRIFVNDTIGRSATATTPLIVNSSPSTGAPVITYYAVSPSTVTTGASITFTVSAYGGIGYVRYAYSGLPEGCVSANSSTLTCTPTVAGGYIVTVYVNDSAKHSATATTPLIVNSPAPTPNLVISAFAASPAIVTVGSSTTLTVSVSGGAGSLSFAYAGLPAGCLSANATSVSCVPTVSGNFTVRVFVNDTAKQSVSASAPFIVTKAAVASGPVISSFIANPNSLSLGSDTVISVSASGGVGTLTYAYTGLPAGCSTTDSAMMTCTPSAVGSYLIIVYVNDTLGHSSTTSTPLNVVAPTPVQQTTNQSSFLGLSSGGVAALLAVVAVAMVVVGFFLSRMLGQKKKGQAAKATGSDAEESGDSDEEAATTTSGAVSTK
jgi:hypothetical protein